MTLPTPERHTEIIDVGAHGSQLADLAALYPELKAAADAATERLKAVTDAIKHELSKIPADRVELRHPAIRLTLSRVESWRLDTKRLKAERPETYVEYARKSESYVLREGR